MRRLITLGRLALCAALGALAGCGALPRNAVPPELMREATLIGMPEVRAPAGRLNATIVSDLRASFTQESPKDFPVGPDGHVRYAHLALSGGGANGAYGAGFLNGWTKAGTRPTFKIVTGVSTGALMAPFAFLGPEFDDALRDFYTTTSSRHIFRMLSIVPQLLGGESLADTEPLRALIAQNVDEGFLRRIAQAHEGGRRLYVGTVDLDSQRFIVWNMGVIAASGRQGALEMFRRVILASASVPIAFPPVFFEVEAGGRTYDEMHVDGAIGARVFYSGGVFSFSAAREGVGRGTGREDVYVIHNGQLLPSAAITPRTLRGIASRAFDSAGKSAVVGDLFRIFATTSREEAGFHWVTIPENFQLGGTEAFDPVKMSELYEGGYRNALAGPQWSTDLPGMHDRAAAP